MKWLKQINVGTIVEVVFAIIILGAVAMLFFSRPAAAENYQFRGHVNIVPARPEEPEPTVVVVETCPEAEEIKEKDAEESQPCVITSVTYE